MSCFKILLLVQPLLFVLPLKDNTFESGFWYDYKGNIHGEPINIYLSRVDDTNFLEGNHCDGQSGTKTQIRGYWKSDSVWLSHYQKDSVFGSFKGIIDQDKNIIGQWTIAEQKTKTNLDLTFDHMVAKGPMGRRYPGLYGTDAAIEDFMKKIKTAALVKDKEWLSNHIGYPLNVKLNKNQRFTISNKKEFLAVFEQVFNDSFNAQLQEYSTCNMFNNYQGVMLGRGEIWIRNKIQLSDSDGKTYEIVAINNF